MDLHINKRENEFSSLTNREKMESLPTGADSVKWSIFRRKYNAAASLSRNESPAQIDVELNSDCNMSCNFCIHSTQKNTHKILSFDEFKNIIDQALEMETFSLKLNYMNEPLLVKDLERYIEYAKNAGMVNIFFSTNGILLDKQRSLSLIKSGITKVFVSIDAADQETYKALRNSDRYNQIVDNVKGFIDTRDSLGLQYPLVRVNFLKNSLNIGQVDDFLELWNGVADIIIIQEMNELIDANTDLFIEKPQQQYHCSFPFKQLVVNASGDILPCCTMHGIKHKIGNIGSMTLYQAWNSQTAEELRQLHTAGRYIENPICRHCIAGK